MVGIYCKKSCCHKCWFDMIDMTLMVLVVVFQNKRDMLQRRDTSPAVVLTSDSPNEQHDQLLGEKDIFSLNPGSLWLHLTRILSFEFASSAALNSQFWFWRQIYSSSSNSVYSEYLIILQFYTRVWCRRYQLYNTELSHSTLVKQMFKLLIKIQAVWIYFHISVTSGYGTASSAYNYPQTDDSMSLRLSSNEPTSSHQGWVQIMGQ